MLKTFLVSAVLGLLFAGCATSDNSKSANLETAEQKLARYQKNIDGDWKWREDERYMFKLDKGMSYYISTGRPIDTGSYTLTLENPQPKAGYMIMCQVFSAGKMVFFKNEKKQSELRDIANIRKAYAVLGMNDHFLQLMDIETGTFFEYVR